MSLTVKYSEGMGREGDYLFLMQRRLFKLVIFLFYDLRASNKMAEILPAPPSQPINLRSQSNAATSTLDLLLFKQLQR